MTPVDERLREALHQRAETVVPNQPHWEDLTTRPTRARRARPGQRVWLVAATAVLVVLLPYLLIAHYVRPGARLRVGGGQSPSNGGTNANSATTGPPDQSLAAGFSPVSVTRISLQMGWALGTSPCGVALCTALARTRDGGATWHAVPVPPAVLAPAGAAVSRVRFANATDGWLFGPQVWATHDGGTTWQKVVALTSEVTSLEAANGIAWGLAVDGATATVYTAPVGTNDWKAIGPAAVTPATGISLHGRVGYASAPDGAIVALTPTGAQERGAPCAAATVSAVAAAGDADVAVVCTADAGAGSSTKTLVLSQDGGMTWDTAGTPPRSGQTIGLAAASVHTYVVGATSGASYLYRTADSGKTWTTVFSDGGGGAAFVDLGFTDPTNGVAVLGDVPPSRLLVSSDAGATWQVQVLAP